MVSKPGWLKDSIAKADGYYSPKGEKLKGEMLTADQIAEWNGTSAPKAEMLVEAPTSAEDLTEMAAVEETETATLGFPRRKKKKSK